MGSPISLPPPPPSVTSQMGQSPASAIAAHLAANPAGAGPAHPQGAILGQAMVLEKALNKMAETAPEFAPYAHRMIETLHEGVSAATRNTHGGPTPPPPPPENHAAPSGLSGGAPFPG